MSDTIFALSSGAPPAAIGIIRISGPDAGDALERLAGRLPAPRRGSRARLRDAAGDLLDDAMVLWLPGPATATGEDLAELHCHGGRAVLAQVERSLAALPKLRRATAGEFTRRAFLNGRIDMAEAEGLADLLSAETELQRRAALAMASGAFSETVAGWREELLGLSAVVEALLDFGDEDDVGALRSDFPDRLDELRGAISGWLARPRAEALREGFRVVLAGPPNSGKSTLFNALVESEAAIVAPDAGTTRDVITRAVALDGMPFLFVDTAGLRDFTPDGIEAIGIERARSELLSADLVLWLGEEGNGPEGSWDIESQVDRPDRTRKSRPRYRLSARTGEGMDGLRAALTNDARSKLPKPGDAALSARQRHLLGEAEAGLAAVGRFSDPLLIAEHLRLVRVALDKLVGRTTTEDMLDALFGRFCIGK